jgi:enoyl-CoA hydratase/carnithine racemase
VVGLPCYRDLQPIGEGLLGSSRLCLRAGLTGAQGDNETGRTCIPRRRPDGTPAMRICCGRSSSGVADILVRVEPDRVAVVTLNRPARRNAVSLAMWRELARTFRELSDEGAVRLVILTGAGGHFCAGADISEFAAVRGDAAAGRAYEAAVEGCYEALCALGKPTVAAISGSCVGGGCALAMACDFRIADPTARFGIPAARLGVVYTVRECRMLLSLVGLAGAKRILFGGELVGIEEALRLGLVDGTAEVDVVQAAVAFAGPMRDNAPLSIAGAKLILNALACDDLEAKADAIEALMHRALESEDSKEGARAFMAKRRPAFKGR